MSDHIILVTNEAIQELFRTEFWIFGSPSQNVLKLDLKKSRLGPISGIFAHFQSNSAVLRHNRSQNESETVRFPVSGLVTSSYRQNNKLMTNPHLAITTPSHLFLILLYSIDHETMIAYIFPPYLLFPYLGKDSFV